MLAKRIIPCLDVKDGRVVKGTNFQGLRDMADPVEMARFYNASGADELVFYDITASAEGRNLFTDILRAVASEIFIPLTVGGGIRTLDDFDRVLKCGADKVSVNSGAIADPSLIGAAAKKYGDQCVVLSMDVKRVDGQFRLFAKGGREDTGIDAMEWAVRGVENGAGEIVLNSIDTDGVKEGFDLPMLDALGGAGGSAHHRQRRRGEDGRTLRSSSPTPASTRGWPPPFSTPARWTSAASSGISGTRAWRCGFEKDGMGRADFSAVLPMYGKKERKTLWN